jgi:hypothetical protein
MPIPENSQKIRNAAPWNIGKWDGAPWPLANFPNPARGDGTGGAPARLGRQGKQKGTDMLGKIAGALIGKRLAGRGQGGKCAIIGYGAAAVARRSIPALAALVLGGWAFKKFREKRRAEPDYPSEAAPSPPSG